AYAIATATGLAVLLDPTQELVYALQATLPLLGGPLVIGGTLGILGVIPGWWWVERLALLILSGALTIYAVSMFWVNIEAKVSLLGPLGLVLLSRLVFVIRWVSTVHYRYEPRR